MGREIVYCEVCGDRILEWEFEEGRAVTWENKNFCFKCKTTAIEKLGKDAFSDAVLQDPPPPSTSEHEQKKHQSSGRMRAVTPPPPPVSDPAAPPQRPVSPRRRSRFGRRSGAGAGRSSRSGGRTGRGERGEKDERDKDSRFAPKKKTNWKPWIIGGVGLLFLILIIASCGGKKKPQKKIQSNQFEDFQKQ